METMGHADVRPDRVLTTDDAALIALECGYEPVVDDALAFDIYPDPPAGDSADTPARPPIVCVMGHVDHGKTTLLDALRSTSVAAGEAGGITQHIGAFQIGLDEVFEATGKASGALSSDSQQTITFLDTPGHAAFSEMRSRGANVTDVAVVVVAADDGVKPQTKEVIDLVKKTDVGVVVAITKCDKPGVDLHQTRAGIYGAGLEIEILGGDVPCVEVSAVTKKGLSELVETIAAVAEVRDLRAEQKGVRFQGRVIESDLGRERGAVTTILVLRGTLEVGSNLIAGHCYGRARQLFSASGEALQQALPGQPVQVTGWRTLPPAGAEVLLADSEDDAKRATENRIRRQAQFEALAEVEAINEKRSTRQDERESVKLETEGMNRQEKRQLAWHKDQAIRAQNRDEDSKVKELTVVVRADVAGTLEAVVAAIGGLGNDAVKVKVIGEGVGSVTESDVALAAAAKGIVVGFNVDIDRAAFPLLGLHQVPCHTETVIYRLIDLVTEKLAALLPKRYEDKVAGEATVLQVFETNLKKNQKQMIAGCRVGNGEVRKGCRIRLTRDMRTIWEGPFFPFTFASAAHSSRVPQAIWRSSDRVRRMRPRSAKATSAAWRSPSSRTSRLGTRFLLWRRSRFRDGWTTVCRWACMQRSCRITYLSGQRIDMPPFGLCETPSSSFSFSVLKAPNAPPPDFAARRLSNTRHCQNDTQRTARVDAAKQTHEFKILIIARRRHHGSVRTQRRMQDTRLVSLGYIHDFTKRWVFVDGQIHIGKAMGGEELPGVRIEDDRGHLGRGLKRVEPGPGADVPKVNHLCWSVSSR